MRFLQKLNKVQCLCNGFMALRDPSKSKDCAGFVGAIKGVGRGVQHVITRPLKGVGLAAECVLDSITPNPHQGSHLKCFMPAACKWVS